MSLLKALLSKKIIIRHMKKNEELLRIAIRSIISESQSPGGAITDLGATFVVDPKDGERQIRIALEKQKGNVRKAAKELGISTRQLYNRLSDTPGLEKLKDRLQNDPKRNEEDERKQ